MLLDIARFMPIQLARIVRHYTGMPRWVRVSSYRPLYNATLRDWMAKKRIVYTWKRIL